MHVSFDCKFLFMLLLLICVAFIVILFHSFISISVTFHTYSDIFEIAEESARRQQQKGETKTKTKRNNYRNSNRNRNENRIIIDRIELSPNTLVRLSLSLSLPISLLATSVSVSISFLVVGLVGWARAPFSDPDQICRHDSICSALLSTHRYRSRSQLFREWGLAQCAGVEWPRPSHTESATARASSALPSASAARSQSKRESAPPERARMTERGRESARSQPADKESATTLTVWLRDAESQSQSQSPLLLYSYVYCCCRSSCS